MLTEHVHMYMSTYVHELPKKKSHGKVNSCIIMFRGKNACFLHFAGAIVIIYEYKLLCQSQTILFMNNVYL